MKKVIEVLNKEIAKKSERISNAIKAKEAIDINNQASIKDFMDIVKGLDDVYADLKRLNQVRNYINSFPKEEKRGRPKKEK